MTDRGLHTLKQTMLVVASLSLLLLPLPEAFAGRSDTTKTDGESWRDTIPPQMIFSDVGETQALESTPSQQVNSKKKCLLCKIGILKTHCAAVANTTQKPTSTKTRKKCPFTTSCKNFFKNIGSKISGSFHNTKKYVAEKTYAKKTEPKEEKKSVEPSHKTTVADVTEKKEKRVITPAETQQPQTEQNTLRRMKDQFSHWINPKPNKLHFDDDKGIKPSSQSHHKAPPVASTQTGTFSKYAAALYPPIYEKTAQPFEETPELRTPEVIRDFTVGTERIRIFASSLNPLEEKEIIEIRSSK